MIGLILAAVLLARDFLLGNGAHIQLYRQTELPFWIAVAVIPFIASLWMARSRRSFLAGINVGWVSGLVVTIAPVAEDSLFLHRFLFLYGDLILFLTPFMASILGGLIGRLSALRS
ncbi:MAG TPA: hypothetical protein VGR57_11025 [Ktedonobacterales bacterium]|nr:hypothetical protein [Ktedonobacterales bacterium]